MASFVVGSAHDRITRPRGDNDKLAQAALAADSASRRDGLRASPWAGIATSPSRALAENRETLRAFIGTNMLLSLAIFVAVYAAAIALSLPGGAVLTIAGGFLFGWLLGRGRLHRRRDDRRFDRISHCQKRARRSPGGAGGPLAFPLSPGISGGCLQLSVILAARPDFSVLAGQFGAWTARRELRDLCRDHHPWHYPGDFCLRAGRQWPRQRYRGAASCAPILPCQDRDREAKSRAHMRSIRGRF